jgi:nucleotide-binding universal stress UspA family protein
MRRILYATDGSEASAPAFAVAQCFMNAQPLAELTVLYVSEDLPRLFGFRPEAYWRKEEVASDEIKRRVLQSLPGEMAGRVRYVHEYGRPATVICEFAQAWKADLVILGTHGRGMIDRLVLGSVSQEVLRRAEVPVMVVPCRQKRDGFAVERILFATDGNPGAYRAEHFAKEFLEIFPKSDLLSIYVQDVNNYGVYSGFAEQIYSLEEERARDIERALCTRTFSKYGARHRFYTVQGHPVQSICNVAVSSRADFIVLGSHRHGMLDRWILGSVGEGVVHHAPVPVVIVKDPVPLGVADGVSRNAGKPVGKR